MVAGISKTWKKSWTVNVFDRAGTRLGALEVVGYTIEEARKKAWCMVKKFGEPSTGWIRDMDDEVDYYVTTPENAEEVRRGRIFRITDAKGH